MSKTDYSALAVSLTEFSSAWKIARPVPNTIAVRCVDGVDFPLTVDMLDRAAFGLAQLYPADEALQARMRALGDDAARLAADLRKARDAAPAGEKAGFRYPLRLLEQAIAKIEGAAK